MHKPSALSALTLCKNQLHCWGSHTTSDVPILALTGAPQTSFFHSAIFFFQFSDKSLVFLLVFFPLFFSFVFHFLSSKSAASATQSASSSCSSAGSSTVGVTGQSCSELKALDTLPMQHVSVSAAESSVALDHRSGSSVGGGGGEATLSSLLWNAAQPADKGSLL